MNRTLFAYLFFVSFFTIFSFAFVDANLSYFKSFYTGLATSHRLFTSLTYSLAIVIFFIFYWRLIKENQNFNKIILITLILIFSYSAMLSQDIFNYITTAKVIFNYHENPYIVMPIEFTNDSNLLFTQAVNKIALYGPIWIILTGIPYIMGFGKFILVSLNFKLLSTFFYLGTTYIIRKSSNNFSALLFALNPLVIIETLISNHNDITMIFLALFSFFLLKKKKIFVAILIFTSSVFIKYATIFLLPVFLFAVYKTWKKEKIDWNYVYFLSAVSMFAIFILSAFRVEIYPWYAIWFLSFTALIPERKNLLLIALSFSFGLLFRYVPFMYLGTHFGITPIMKTAVTFIPPILVLLYVYSKKVFTQR